MLKFIERWRKKEKGRDLGEIRSGYDQMLVNLDAHAAKVEFLADETDRLAGLVAQWSDLMAVYVDALRLIQRESHEGTQGEHPCLSCAEINELTCHTLSGVFVKCGKCGESSASYVCAECRMVMDDEAAEGG